MTDVWDNYRQVVRDEHAKYYSRLSVQTQHREFNAEVRARTAALMERFNMLRPRLRTGGADDATLISDVEQLLQDHEDLRDRECPPGSSDREDLQFRCNNLMMYLARIAAAQGRPGQSNEWFTRAAEGWLVLGDQASAEQCTLEAAEASLADGNHPDIVLERLDSWLDDSAPVRKSRLLSSAARALLDAGDLTRAQQRVTEAAQTLDAAGFSDPATAGSTANALTLWMNTGHQERMPDLPWLQFTCQLNSVATIWAKLTGMRFRLGLLPQEQALPAMEELFALARRLITEAQDFHNAQSQGGTADAPRASAPSGDANLTGRATDRSFERNIERARRLAALHAQAQGLKAGDARLDGLLAEVAELESEAAQAGDALTASYAAIERADTLFDAHRFGDGAAVLDAARGRLHDGDGLDAARRRTLLVQLYRRSAFAAGMQQDFTLLSELCGEGIAESENDRDKVNEPYLQDSYLRDRAMLYQLGMFAAWELGEHELAVVRADLAKARGSLGWAIRPGSTGEIPPAEIASLRSQWAQVARAQSNAGAMTRRRAIWSRLMTAHARSRPAAPSRLTLAAVQAALDPDEAIIYYFFVDSETLLIYTISPTEIAAERKILGTVRTKLDKLADGIKVLDGDVDWLDWDLLSLGAHLLPDDTAHTLDKAQRLLICPHRILHQVPLHALNWKQERLIERFAVSYIPNVTSLLLTRPALPPTAVLSVGIDTFPSPLPDLLGAEQEADDVAVIYERHGASATVLRGAKATVSTFDQMAAKGDLERFAVLHLATHGKDHPDDEPNEASLYLADGAIDAMDISQWTLNADLVALSACWSGRRPAHGRRAGASAENLAGPDEELFGDEVYGLQAAFFAAGARQVLGTMWPLDNETGPAVMTAFHAGVSCSQPPEVALQAAVHQQLSADMSAYHWAPYKLITLGRLSTQTTPTRIKEA